MCGFSHELHVRKDTYVRNSSSCNYVSSVKNKRFRHLRNSREVVSTPKKEIDKGRNKFSYREYRFYVRCLVRMAFTHTAQNVITRIKRRIIENNKSRAIRDDFAPGLLEKRRAGLAERERRRKEEMKKRRKEMLREQLRCETTKDSSVLRRPMGFKMGLKTVVAWNRPPGISNDFRLQAVISDYTYFSVVLFAFSFVASSWAKHWFTL